MDALIHWARSRLFSLSQFFAHSDRKSERSAFGLGQFVLLLTLGPFIFNLSLYSFSETQEVASHYEYQADRFEPFQPFIDKKLPKKPRPPKKFTQWESKRMSYCHNPPKIIIIRWVPHKECQALNKKRSAYNADNKKYKKDLTQYYNKIKDLKKKKTHTTRLSQSYQANLSPYLRLRLSRHRAVLLVRYLAHLLR